MSNDQAPMTNETKTKRQCPILAIVVLGHWTLLFDWSLGLGHWSLLFVL
jgi:hypothetical protein